MSKNKANGTPDGKPVIVYRQKSEAQVSKEKTFSFIVTDEQSAFIKVQRKDINFSTTFRNYLDSIIETVNKEQKSKQ